MAAGGAYALAVVGGEVYMWRRDFMSCWKIADQPMEDNTMDQDLQPSAWTVMKVGGGGRGVWGKAVASV